MAVAGLTALPLHAQSKLMIPAFGGNASAGAWSTADINPRAAGDANGDGKADVIGFANDGVYVALSSGTNFQPATRWVAS